MRDSLLDLALMQRAVRSLFMCNRLKAEVLTLFAWRGGRRLTLSFALLRPSDSSSGLSLDRDSEQFCDRLNRNFDEEANYTIRELVHSLIVGMYKRFIHQSGNRTRVMEI